MLRIILYYIVKSCSIELSRRTYNNIDITIIYLYILLRNSMSKHLCYTTDRRGRRQMLFIPIMIIP